MSLQARFQLNYGDFDLDVSLDLPSHGTTVLFGPSGSGKTTVLRCMAGLEPQARGTLVIDDICWQDDQQNRFLPTHQRELGMIFQEASLFPHLNVHQNLNYGLRRARTKYPSTSSRIDLPDILALLDIAPLLDRTVDKLSGGERQRVAIARALLTAPRLLLMDEPLSALDFKRKQDILPYLVRLQKTLAIPILYVSHAIEEVVKLADHLVLLDQGRVVASGPTTDTLSRMDLPAIFAEESSVVIDARVEQIDTPYHLARLQFGDGHLWVPVENMALGDTTRVRVHARDVSITLAPHTDSSILNCLPATITSFSPALRAGHCLVRCQTDHGTPIMARITHRSFDTLGLHAGQAVWLQIKAVSLV